MDAENGFQRKSNEELLTEYKQTCALEIKQELVLRYVHIVRNIALQMRNVYLGFSQLDDVVNEGVLVIMNAIEKFDLERNVKFETYISKRIRGMIIDLARKQDWIPRGVRKSAKDIDNATLELYNETGRFPKPQEVADFLGIGLDKYQEILGKTTLFNVLSLDVLLEETSIKQKNNEIAAPHSPVRPEQHTLDKELKGMLVDGIKDLRDNEQTVLSLYYVEELNMKDIAKVMQLSEPRISQIHSNAIRKLRISMQKTMG
ncbi:sigma-70 family RNA polymerase sigma factor [Parasporobacterium paucivorans]|uniref:RNA polymerase sigma factor for flagellar operon FliA n=1 Tax=Parasporobacterium paucivorans DSM 15970 TaxID=1122934 RepID=A0A1M6I9X1_9FIRM|nr:FliA/WhiG family RNA polymerase sigma factor [Parasporobacterium paucivorans]SHJ31222.1 RNA polymerase sigma factor for flagellar operon FliA [Parasporobacterium paucivorans DSM 15970]